MAKLKFRQASEIPDAQAFAKAPGQLRLPPATNVMQSVEYENLPWKALTQSGKALQQIANMAFDYHIYDLEKSERDRKIAEGDMLDDAAGRMADFMSQQKIKYRDPNAYAGFVQEAAKAGKNVDDYIIEQQAQEQEDKIGDIMALPEFKGMLENDGKLKKRLQTRLNNVARSDSDTIAAYAQGAESQRLNLAETNAKSRAINEIKQKAFDTGITTRFWISRKDPSMASQSVDAFEGVLDQAFENHKNQFDTPEKQFQFKEYLRSYFLDKQNNLKQEALTSELDEHQQNLVRAVKEAENIFVKKLGKLEMDNLLSHETSAEGVQTALKEIEESIAGAANEAAKPYKLFGKEKEKLIGDVVRELKGVFYREAPQELRRVLSYVEKREGEIKAAEAQDLDVKRRDALTEYGVREANVIELWERGDINAKEAKNQLEQIGKDIHDEFRVTPAKGEPQEQVQADYNQELKSSVNQALKATSGRLQIGQVSIDKATQAEIDERVKNDRIRTLGVAAADFEREITKLKLEIQSGKGKENHNPEKIAARIQAVREEIINKHVEDFSGINDPQFNPNATEDGELRTLLTSELGKIGLSDEENLSLLVQQSHIDSTTQEAATEVYNKIKAEGAKLLDPEQTPDLDLSTAAQQFNEFATGEMETMVESWSDHENYPVVAENLIQTSEFSTQIPTLVANYQKEVNRRLTVRNIDATQQAVENIIVERADLGELGPQVRSFEDEANWLVGRDQNDIHARAIAFKYSKLVQSGDMEGPDARRAVDGALTRMDEMDANKMILNNPRKALDLLKGEGFPKLQGTYRNNLIRNAESNIEDQDAVDAFTIQTFIDNHFRAIRRNDPVGDPLTELKGKVDDSRLNALRGQENYEKLLAQLNFGTSDKNIPAEYEPDRPIQYKSKGALRAMQRDFQSDTWFQSVDWQSLGIDPNLVNREQLGRAWSGIDKQIEDTIKIRETPKTRGVLAAQRYDQLFGSQPLPPPANEEQALFAQQAPEVYSMLQPERMKFMESEQLLYDPNRKPVLFSSAEFEAINKRWSGLDANGRAMFLSGIESVAGENAGSVLEDLDENTEIGYEMQFYGDVKLNSDAALHLHMSMIDSDESLNNRAFPSEKQQRKDALAKFDEAYDSDISIGGYLRNFPVSDEREARRDVIRKVAKVKMAIARDSGVELTPENAFKAAMKDLVHDNWVLAPSGPGVKSTFQVPRTKVHKLVQGSPERITDSLMRHLNELSADGQLNEAAKIIHNEDKMTFWVNAPDNSGLIAMGVMQTEDFVPRETGALGFLATGDDYGLQAYQRASMRPIRTKDNKMIKLTWGEIHDRSLEEYATRRGFELEDLPELEKKPQAMTF